MSESEVSGSHSGRTEDAFQVLQTYDEIGQMIFDRVVDALTPPPEEYPSKSECAYAEQIARRVRDGVLMHLDAA